MLPHRHLIASLVALEVHISGSDRPVRWCRAEEPAYQHLMSCFHPELLFGQNWPGLEGLIDAANYAQNQGLTLVL